MYISTAPHTVSTAPITIHMQAIVCAHTHTHWQLHLLPPPQIYVQQTFSLSATHSSRLLYFTSLLQRESSRVPTGGGCTVDLHVT